jgi:hypothetical protein
MVVGIESIDSISVEYGVKRYKKLAVDFPDSSTYGMIYRVIFDEQKSEAEIGHIKSIFENDENIEYARLEYHNYDLNWEPQDYFFDDFTPVADPSYWPCHNQNPNFPNCGGAYFTSWGDAFVEQWWLKNDGTIFVNTDCPFPQNDVRYQGESGEDIKAVDAWEYYLNWTLDPNGIPGDPSVAIGHMDTGVDYDNPEVADALWFNPEEDHGDPGVFDPDLWCEFGGDLGSPTMADGFPGLPGDDDGDGYLNWEDKGIIDIISNLDDNDGDEGIIIEWPPGYSYTRNGTEDEPHIIRPPDQPYLCDCPHTLVDVVDPSDPFGRRFSESDLGTEGYDDDEDGYVDECDGAMWDDDENGYVDDVIGWDFAEDDNQPYWRNTDPNSNAQEKVHGTETFGYIASSANQDPENPGIPPCGYYELDSNFGNIRKGIVGVCPDCKVAVLRGGVGKEGIFWGYTNKIELFVQAGWWNGTAAEIGQYAFDLGGLYFSPSGNDFCQRRVEWLVDGDRPFMIDIGGTRADGNCQQATPSRVIDISAPAYPLISTRAMTSNLLNPPEYNPWYMANIGWIGQGTSSAVQFAAGAAGLLLSFSKNHINGPQHWTNVDIMNRLIDGSEKYDPDYKYEYSRSNYNGPPELWRPIGEGRLDVNGAIRLNDPMGNLNCSVMNSFVDISGIGPGNQDGVVSQNETFGFYFKVFNYSNQLGESNWTITSNNPYVHMQTGSITFPEMPQMDSVTNESFPFSVYVAPDAPIGSEISIDLTIDEIGGPSVTIHNALVVSVSATEPYTINNVFPESCFPVVCELDGDPYPEIVYNTSSYTKAINAEDGSLIWSNEWHPRIPNTVTQPHSPSAGDIDGDGFNEVVLMGINMSGTKAIAAINHDGQTLATFDFDFPSEPYYRQPLVLADWDSDGKLDIIAVVNSGSPNIQIIGYNESSGSLEEIQFIHFPGILSINGIATADLNNDHQIDLILSTGYYNSLCIYDNSTQEIIYDGFTGGSYSPPVVADVDNDSWLEIIYKIDVNPTQVRLVNLEEEPPSNILLMETDPDYEIGNSNFSVGDWDNNDILEIFFESYKIEVADPPTKIHVYNYDGTGEDFTIYRFTGMSFLMQSEILIADLNSDFQGDLIFRGKNIGREIWGLKGGIGAAGQGIWDEEYQRILSADFATEYTTPIIEDMDLDGDIDIFVNTPKNYDASFNGTLELFSTGGEYYDGALQWPQYRHDARRTGLYAQPVTTLDVTSDMTIWDNLVVWDNITVAENATLTIKPGVSIKMKPGCRIEVNGSLIAHGNPSESISFTGTDAAAGSWTGIMVIKKLFN